MGKTIEKLLKIAMKGDAEAQYLMGLYYYYSNDNRDIDEAIKWWQKAADQGYTEARYNLSVVVADLPF